MPIGTSGSKHVQMWELNPHHPSHAKVDLSRAIAKLDGIEKYPSTLSDNAVFLPLRSASHEECRTRIPALTHAFLVSDPRI
jgi:hypothetical protein